MRAYRQARAEAARLRAALVAAGMRAGDFPGLIGTVDEAGNPVVAFGRVTPEAARRLVRILRKLPTDALDEHEPPPGESIPRQVA